MTKSDLPITGDYTPVADRITLFYERYPEGQIHTELVSDTPQRVVFKAVVYRRPADARPSATGWAAELVDDGDVNAVACVENTETSAVGRALANLGFTASLKRPSREEMEKAARGRARKGVLALDADPLQARANDLMDVISLLAAAEREGMRPLRAQAIRAWLTTTAVDPRLLRRIDVRLRRWIARHRSRRSM